ncbi:probable photolyase/blue-light receptor [Cyanidioschyzon merolae strain 10D]|jgi:deoxyribodipyrimidine photo-lyase|uniref:Probable photolyase/blue-light receptor n=1 Tax=Cyanidioschyzon merolae (strain NIES-3377 / 10D) TaxID=280699 RepID=M1VF92_CYAM1|nr:probable photolyase/blue-light receptor [Cyanidioschyzon merolae strain 10D]BAM79193.1 probable photolyase/blue-light receptor [Cyanidioschyzon merolae strain 10D]|eukprot:XP_005535479.1 probable photolyase/blue-light receptor [Cyanidioschyzon merolae strain 10D]
MVLGFAFVSPTTSALTVLRQHQVRHAGGRVRRHFREHRHWELASRTHQLVMRGCVAERSSEYFGSGAAVRNLQRLSLHPAPQFIGSEYGGNAEFGGKNGGTVLLWFRSDLRLDDNPALCAALEEGASVLPVYCFDPRQFGKTSFGFEKTGRYRAKFLIESVADLRKALKKKGNNLLIRIGKPEEVIPDLCRKYEIKKVFYHQEVTYEELECEEAVARKLEDMKVEVHPFWTNTLYAVEDLPFPVEETPDVYTEYRLAVESKSRVRDPLAAPDEIRAIPRHVEYGTLPTLEDLGLGQVPKTPEYGSASTAGSSLHHFRGGESEAQQRLAQYVQDAKHALSVGGDVERAAAHLGADFSCKISPWLALGCVSPRRIFAEIRDHALNGAEGAQKSTTFFELVWRDFFRLITYKYSTSRLRKSERAAGMPHKASVAAAAPQAS